MYLVLLCSLLALRCALLELPRELDAVFGMFFDIGGALLVITLVWPLGPLLYWVYRRLPLLRDW